MQSKRDLIPVHRLEESTDQGFELERLTEFGKSDADSVVAGLHRDDHYIFILQESGKCSVTNDFENYTLEAGMVMCIFPGVVHGFYVIDTAVTGWFMALDPGLVPETFRMVLEDPFLSRPPLAIGVEEMAELIRCAELIHLLQQRPPTTYTRAAIYSLLASFTAMVTGLYADRQEVAAGTITRAQQITREFRRLLAAEFKTWKSPSDYAAALHLSPSYFNEAVKEATGFNVGYWIQKQIALEAKRLLYYGKCSVKEIAHELGYEDHAYFSSQMCFLGDETTIGHFLALQQLAGPGSAISGAILLAEPHHQQEFHDYFRGWDIAPLRKQGDSSYRELGDWVGALDTREHADTVFYLAGYIPGLVDLRRQLRRKGFSGGQVKTQGFWD